METATRPRASARDFFLHLLSMVTLYIAAGSFLGVIFQLINLWIPDPLEYRMHRGEGLRFALSALIVVFPVYMATMIGIHKDWVKEPVKRMLGIRKWLIWFTLFVAALIMIGDCVALLNTLLGGELTFRFVLKAFSILAVMGAIFGYYLWDIRKVESEKV